jgi:hypothetical protein
LQLQMLPGVIASMMAARMEAEAAAAAICIVAPLTAELLHFCDGTARGAASGGKTGVPRDLQLGGVRYRC